MKMIGEILVENGLLKPADLNAALEKQKSLEEHKPLGEVLISMGLINFSVLMDYLDIQLKD